MVIDYIFEYVAEDLFGGIHLMTRYSSKLIFKMGPYTVVYLGQESTSKHEAANSSIQAFLDGEISMRECSATPCVDSGHILFTPNVSGEMRKIILTTIEIKTSRGETLGDILMLNA